MHFWPGAAAVPPVGTEPESGTQRGPPRPGHRDRVRQGPKAPAALSWYCFAQSWRVCCCVQLRGIRAWVYGDVVQSSGVNRAQRRRSKRVAPAASAVTKPASPAERMLMSAVHGEPVDRLRSARRLAVMVDRLERDAWRACRAEGMSWAELAKVTRLTRSGASSRANQLENRSFTGNRQR